MLFLAVDKIIKYRSKIIVGVLVILTMLAYYVSHQLQVYVSSPILIQQETLFTIKKGVGRQELENLLAEQGIITPSNSFFWVVRLNRQFANFKAGTYRLEPSMTIKQMLLLFHTGKEVQFSIQFIEGWTLQNWIKQLDAAPYLQHTLSSTNIQATAKRLDRNNLEGWLYPDTYLYTVGSSDESILIRAEASMQEKLSRVWENRDPSVPYKTPKELLVMASMIEKETGIDSERPIVASVFINRLHKNMKLQSDPTVIYGIQNTYKGQLTTKDLNKWTPYNTYQISGLPPTPICMPSMASMIAAAHPAKTDYLYFVADGSGKHTFNRTLQEHNRAVAHYLKIVRQKKNAR